jgi:hypothetical protein
MSEIKRHSPELNDNDNPAATEQEALITEREQAIDQYLRDLERYMYRSVGLSALKQGVEVYDTATNQTNPGGLADIALETILHAAIL